LIIDKTMKSTAFLSIVIISLMLCSTEVMSIRKSSKGLNAKNRKSNSNRPIDMSDDLDSNPSTSKRRKSGRSKQKRMKIPGRNVILPSKKEPISTKAIRGIEILKKSLLVTAETVISSSKKAQRELKAYFSSDFEILLLKLTRPDDERPSDMDVENMLLTIESFSRNMDLTDEENPYRITLHKLWVKMAEPDERTVLKALFLLHTVLRSAEPEDAIIFRTLILKMSREMCVKTQSKYFDLSRISTHRPGSSEEEREQQDTENTLIYRYATYCMKRGRAATSDFEELRLVGLGMRAEDICAQILKAIKLMDVILSCKPRPGEEGEASMCCLEMLAIDLRELFQLFSEKLRWLLQENQESGGAVFEGWSDDEVSTVISRFKSFHNTRYEDVQSFIADVGAALELYGIKLPTSMDVPSFIGD